MVIAIMNLSCKARHTYSHVWLLGHSNRATGSWICSSAQAALHGGRTPKAERLKNPGAEKRFEPPLASRLPMAHWSKQVPWPDLDSGVEN